jgi:NAD(P)-dependent dehydrogenase (short-subunit alcohol dehydrogenase family)
MATTYAGTKVFSIGGSRNIGYFSAIRLLEKGATVTFLLRSPSSFDADVTIQKYIKSGTARLVQGDALIKDDVKKGWVEAAKGEGEERVDVVLFTVGGTPKFELTKGFTVSPSNLVTHSFLNVVSTLPPNHPKIITISSTGLTKKIARQPPSPTEASIWVSPRLPP